MQENNTPSALPPPAEINQLFMPSALKCAIGFRGNASTFTPTSVSKILKILASGQNRSYACARAGVTVIGLNQFMRQHPEAVTLIEQAEDAGLRIRADKLEDKAFELATKGAKEPITYQGEITDWYQRAQPEMLKFLLERTHERYAPKRDPGSQVQINIGLGDRLDAALRKSREAKADGTIDAGVQGK